MSPHPRFPTVEKCLWGTLFAGIVLLAAWLRIASPPVTARSPDENYYASYATQALAQPFSAPRILVASYNDNPDSWLYPVPLRIAHYFLMAAIMKAWGLPALSAGAAAATAGSLLQFAVVGVIGLRFFSRWSCLAALAFLSVCPADLAMARRAWGDDVVAGAAAVLVWLCMEIACRPRARGWAWYAALWLWSIFFMLLKESGGVFFGLCMLGLTAATWRETRSWRRVALILAGTVLTAWAAFAPLALLSGGVPAVFAVIHHNVIGLARNDYAALYQSGPWYSFPLALWVLSPLSALSALLAFGALLLPRYGLVQMLALDRRQETLVWGLAGLIVMVIILATLPAYLQNVRYISFIIGLWQLMAGLGLAYLLACVRRLHGEKVALAGAAFIALVLVLSCRADYLRYRQVFIRGELNDLDILRITSSAFAKTS